MKSGAWTEKLSFKSSRDRNKSEKNKKKPKTKTQNASQSIAPYTSEQCTRKDGMLFTWFTFRIN